MCVWKKASSRKRLIVAIFLPSVLESIKFSFRVAAGGAAIALFIKWPKQLVVLEMLRQNLFNDPNVQYHPHHPEYVGIEEALRTDRNHASPWVESKSFIPFHLRLRDIFREKTFSCDEDSALVFKICLSGIATQYALKHKVTCLTLSTTVRIWAHKPLFRLVIPGTVSCSILNNENSL